LRGDNVEIVSRAPRKPDGWQGPNDGSQRGLRLVLPPKVEARPAQLFPFRSSLMISAMVVGALVIGGKMIWTRMAVLEPLESRTIVVVPTWMLEAPPEEPLESVARQVAALPPPAVPMNPIVVHDLSAGELPVPEVSLSDEPFELSAVWEEAAKPFPVPEPPEPEVKATPKAKPTVAKKSTPPQPARKAAPVKQSPRVARQVPPVYPSAARQAGVEGSVLLQVAVESNGRAGDVLLVSSSGSGLLDAAAMKAVRKWSFRPATINGQPTSGHVRVPVRFQLQ